MSEVVASFKSGLCSQNSIQKAFVWSVNDHIGYKLCFFHMIVELRAVIFEAFQIDNILSGIKIG